MQTPNERDDFRTMSSHKDAAVLKPNSKARRSLPRPAIILGVCLAIGAIIFRGGGNLRDFAATQKFVDSALSLPESWPNKNDTELENNEGKQNTTKRQNAADDGNTKNQVNDDVGTDEDSSATKSHHGANKARKPHKPLNILLLYGDDWRHDGLSIAKKLEVQTPFFDSLAREGVRFTHNCVTTAVCWISRATLYTGQYMSRHNTTKVSNPVFYQQFHRSFPALLQNNGYFTGHVGKWHFNGWDPIAQYWNFSKIYHGEHWYFAKRRRIHVTKRNEADALQFLRERPKHVPFFLSVCFFAPHAVDHRPEQYFPQEESMSLYQDNISIPPSADTWNRMPHFFRGRNEARRRWRWRYDTADKYQSMMKNYFRLITEIDNTSKAIVEELENQGILNETLVIFTTDNGLFHSEHGMAGKWYPHQESIRVPLIVRDPRMSPEHEGSTNDAFTLSIDLATTILSAANVAPSPLMQGRDISELYIEQVKDWRQEFFYEHPTHVSADVIPGSTALVRKNFKYMRWPGHDVEQLFNLVQDPYEVEDLIDDGNYTELITEMRKVHDQLALVVR